MNPVELEEYLRREADAFPGKCAYLVAQALEPEPLHARLAEARVPSASTIKVPILLTALEQVRQGILSLDDLLDVPQEVILPDTEVFEEGATRCSVQDLLYWMITESDNTATNVLLDTLGFDAVNEYCAMTMGLQNTLCQRKMLDFAAAQAGLDNFTSAADQWRMYTLLHSGSILSPSLRRTAFSILARQRSQDVLLRYLPDELIFAHKTGGLDGVTHDCGLFLSTKKPLFVGVFTWEGPSPDEDPGQKRFIGRLGRAIFNTYKEV